MPISPENDAKYPGGSARSKEWRLIRGRIRYRAGDACEGSPAYPDCRAKNYEPHPVTGSKVVCTVAHRDGKLDDHSDENLAFWCQRCHLTHDAKQHAHNAAITRAEKRGQPDLYGRR